MCVIVSVFAGWMDGWMSYIPAVVGTGTGCWCWMMYDVCVMYHVACIVRHISRSLIVCPAGQGWIVAAPAPAVCGGYVSQDWVHVSVACFVSCVSCVFRVSFVEEMLLLSNGPNRGPQPSPSAAAGKGEHVPGNTPPGTAAALPG
ncbi:hypothetical protein EJ05DRAFT_537344 [Pseudovirgaria hyperparasitica]|uniref:Uncharacterized protein n=1 Tax=Pseudovirgaria hyperparasitica TaxID=470096 RepID=A0A6A6WCY7_9PEZI|nr:uncharacterized protein EJ05DRAFT_537344 [Pseudovirgaria hyperparasitica]KAF2758971.1 hypothetical protein EJ05DRAFT_537344 [Pseudovirgaria hyperparasitica]